MTDRWASLEKQKRPQARVETVANLALRHVLIEACGVDTYTLRNLVELKNVLAADFLRDTGGEDKPTPEFIADVLRQLTELAANHSEEIKARECAHARERLYGRQHGFVPSGQQREEAA